MSITAADVLAAPDPVHAALMRNLKEARLAVAEAAHDEGEATLVHNEARADAILSAMENGAQLMAAREVADLVPAVKAAARALNDAKRVVARSQALAESKMWAIKFALQNTTE